MLWVSQCRRLAGLPNGPDTPRPVEVGWEGSIVSAICTAQDHRPWHGHISKHLGHHLGLGARRRRTPMVVLEEAGVPPRPPQTLMLLLGEAHELPTTTPTVLSEDR